MLSRSLLCAVYILLQINSDHIIIIIYNVKEDSKGTVSGAAYVLSYYKHESV